MALKKLKTLSNGYTAEYFRIIQVNIKADGSAYIELALYKDRTTRNSGASYIEQTGYSISSGFDSSTLDTVNLNPIKQAYIKLKESKIENEVETNWFADTEDILES